MQTAGLVLDLYDNPKDMTSIFESLDVVPETIKTAQALSAAERDQLPDDVFALVLMTGDDRLRKYACIDEGNTLLNVAYFFRHGHKLPEVAQKTAAANLAQACRWYDIEVPEELEKVALGLSTVTTALMAPSIIKGTGGQIRDNLAATRAAGDSILTPRDQQHLGSMMKGAEASGTSLLPNQDPGDLSTVGTRGKPGSSNTSVAKSASLQPHVSVLGLEPRRQLFEKRAEHYAFQETFPLDSYTEVQAASAYFDDMYKRMPPDMRHEFAVNMVKRASAMGVPFSKEAAAYGSTGFAETPHLEIALDTRRPFVSEKQAAVLDRVFEHRAALGPEQYAAVLAEFDKLAGIDWRYDHAVLDPYASTFGVKQASADGDSWINGNDYVTKQQILNYGVTATKTLAEDYGEDFMKEFRKDPWGIFNSLPLLQKRRLARAASDNSATGLHDVQ